MWALRVCDQTSLRKTSWKTELVIWHQDPRIGGEVRTQAPGILRRDRALFLTKVARGRLSIVKGDVKSALCIFSAGIVTV